MKKKFSDGDVQKLLSNLKNAEKDYPPDKIEARRDTYQKQAAAMVVLLKAAGVGSNANDGRTSSSAAAGGGSSSVGMLLESALLFTIVLEVFAAAYIYRDKIADFVRTTILQPTEVASSPLVDASTTPAIIPVTGNETASVTPTPSITLTVTETNTPFPVVVSETDTQLPDNVPGYEDEVDNSSVHEEIMSTPPPKDNPGNHYGNTPKPERTKEPGNNAPGNTNKDKKD